MNEIAEGNTGDRGEMRTTECPDSISVGVGGERKGTVVETEMETDMEC